MLAQEINNLLENKIVSLVLSPLSKSDGTAVQNMVKGLDFSTQWTLGGTHFPPF